MTSAIAPMAVWVGTPVSQLVTASGRRRAVRLALSASSVCVVRAGDGYAYWRVTHKNDSTRLAGAPQPVPGTLQVMTEVSRDRSHQAQLTTVMLGDEDRPVTQEDIGARIAARRQRLGWTQEELAARVHVTRSTVVNWETGMNYPKRRIGLLPRAHLQTGPASRPRRRRGNQREAFRDSTGDEGIRRAARELVDAKTARNATRRDYP